MAPKEKKAIPSAGKVIVSGFWTAHEIIFIDYLKERKLPTPSIICKRIAVFE